MSKFWSAGISSESESGSDSESEDEQQTQRQAGGKFGSTFQESDSGKLFIHQPEDNERHRKFCCIDWDKSLWIIVDEIIFSRYHSWLIFVLYFEIDSEDEVRVVKSQKDRAWDTMLEGIVRIRNAKKTNDWSVIQDEFDSVNRLVEKSKMLISQNGIPKFYIKMIAEVEEHLWATMKDKELMKNVKPAVGKAINRMKLTIKKHNKNYEEQIADYRANPEKYEDDVVVKEEESSEEESSDDDEDDDSDSDSDEEEKPKSKPKVRKVIIAKKSKILFYRRRSVALLFLQL